MVLRKSSDLWFSLILVGPDTAEFLFINSAVICRLKLAFNLSQQSLHLPAPQTDPLLFIIRRVGDTWLHAPIEPPHVEAECGANLDTPNLSRSNENDGGKNTERLMRPE